ncbi:MAG: hypothetical protein WBE18_08640 [Gammaproteobacteria bacterium]
MQLQLKNKNNEILSNQGSSTPDAEVVELKKRIKEFERTNTERENENHQLKCKAAEKLDQDSSAEQGSSKKRKITDFFEPSRKAVSFSAVSDAPEGNKMENSASPSPSAGG